MLLWLWEKNKKYKNMRICFKTYITENYKDIYNINKLTNQLKYFHPDIPHILYSDNEIAEDKIKYPWMGPYSMFPISTMKYANEYDLIIHIDGDTTIVGPLDEIIKGDFDVASVRNNHFGRGAGRDNLITIDDIPWDKFINVGLTAIRVDKPNGLKFLHEWLEGCHKGTVSGRWDDENNEFNRHCYKKEYNFKILDDNGSGVSYGINNVFGGRCKQTGLFTLGTHWESWKDLYVKNNELYQINPLNEEVKVKVLHMAGGGAKQEVLKNKTMRNWLNDWVPSEVKTYIEKISK